MFKSVNKDILKQKNIYRSRLNNIAIKNINNLIVDDLLDKNWSPLKHQIHDVGYPCSINSHLHLDK